MMKRNKIEDVVTRVVKRRESLVDKGLVSHSKNITLIALAAASVALGGWPSVASAQNTIASDYTVERFRLASDAEGVLDVEWAAVPKHLEVAMGVWLGYSDDPLTVYAADANGGRTRIGSLVSSRLGGSLVGSIGLWNRFALGVSVPLIVNQEQDASGIQMMASSFSSFGLGDVQLKPKVALVHQDDVGVHLGLSLAVSLPTSSADDYFGDSSALVTPEILLSRSFKSGLRMAANLGYRFRKNTNALNLVVGDELYSHAGVGYRFLNRGGPPLEVDLTYSVATAADDAFGAFNRNFSEARLGASYDMTGPLVIFAASGMGMTEGFGSPDWRALVGMRFQKRSAETGAVIPDVIAVNKKLDSDNDGVWDEDDACPNEPETTNQFEDDDGCPDVIGDKDADGINDLEDRCPTEAEDLDDFEDEDGCPDPDNDGDGIIDVDDKCINVPGVALVQGCPEPDQDGDSVVDRLDTCPNSPGSEEFQGCDAEIIEMVYFRTNKSRILPMSFPFLDKVAAVLKKHQEIAVIHVEGHTDDRGGKRVNKRLSQRRADAVVAYLVNLGVERSRLVAVGFGEETPMETNDSDEGRSSNRRVDFVIIGAKGIKLRDRGPDKETLDGN